MSESSDPVMELVKQVSGLVSEVKGLRKDVDRIERKNDEAVERTSESRSVMHRQIDEVGQRVAKVEGTIGSVQDGIDRVENDIVEGLKAVDKRIDNQVMPTVNKVQIWEQRGIGVLATVGLVSTTFGAAAAAVIYFFWEKAMKFLGSL